MVQIIKAVEWLIAAVQQVWEDSKAGHTIREKDSNRIFKVEPVQRQHAASLALW